VKRGAAAWFKRNMEHLHVGRIESGSWSSAGGPGASEHDKIIDARVIRTRVEDAKK
jgi:hypothetical protein